MNKSEAEGCGIGRKDDGAVAILGRPGTAGFEKSRR